MGDGDSIRDAATALCQGEPWAPSSKPAVTSLAPTGRGRAIRCAWPIEPGTWVEVDIAAPVARVWELVTDIDLPARFSEEFQGGSWLDDGPAPGARFVGRNQHPAIGEWEVECFVEVFDEPRSLRVGHRRPGEPGGPAGGSTSSRARSAPGCGSRCRSVPARRASASPSRRCPTRSRGSWRRRLDEHHANMTRTVEGIKDVAEGRGVTLEIGVDDLAGDAVDGRLRGGGRAPRRRLGVAARSSGPTTRSPRSARWRRPPSRSGSAPPSCSSAPGRRRCWPCRR